jgi:dihydropteroate synthase
MGILNVTPDSFSDGGDFYRANNAVERALTMVEEGADIIDIGGESTRPPGKAYGAGARHITTEEEFKRVIPVINDLRLRSDVLISIDTQKSYIANAAVECGANIINDVSAGTSDDKMFEIAAKRNAPIILMHGHGPNFRKGDVNDYTYSDVVDEVFNYLRERIDAAKSAGVTDVFADVGIGFAKGYEYNLRLLKYHDVFRKLGVPLVLGVSRKASIGVAMSGAWSNRHGHIPAPKDRMIGSIAAACYGMIYGANIIRTHDIKETKQALATISAIQSS